MENKSVSVIVPIYNGECYFKRCIESILNQTYTNLEVILVDDGSKDLSSVLCDEYSKKDNRVKVFHVKNKGVSYARNYGLTRASGYYIQFVDVDDYLAKTATQKLVATMSRHKSDLVVCGYTRLLKGFRLRYNSLDRKRIYSRNEYLCNTLKDPAHHYYGVLWNKLYKREVIQEFKLCFLNDVSLGEDFIFNLHYIKSIKNVSVINDRLYYYNCENTNTLSKYFKTIDSCKNELENRKLIFQQYKNTFVDAGLYEAKKAKVQQYWLKYMARNINYLKYDFSYWSKEEIKVWSDILNGNIEIQKCLDGISKTRFNGLVFIFHSRETMLNLIKRVMNKLSIRNR